MGLRVSVIGGFGQIFRFEGFLGSGYLATAHYVSRNLRSDNGLLDLGRLDSDFGTLILPRFIDL